MRRKFDQSFATSVRAERVIFETLSALGIPYSDAMSTGAEALIIDAIKNGRTGTATREQLDEYLQYQKDTIDQVSGMVRRFNQRKTCIDAIQATLSDRDVAGKRLREIQKAAPKIEKIAGIVVADHEFRSTFLPEFDDNYSTAEGIRQRLVDEISQRCQMDLRWQDIDRAVRKAVQG